MDEIKNISEERGVLFSDAFLKLTEAVDQKNEQAIRETAQTALGLARAMPSAYLESVVLSVAALGNADAGRNSAAVKIYDAALEALRGGVPKTSSTVRSEVITDEQDGERLQLFGVQILFYKGVALLQSKSAQWEQAEETYRQAEEELQKILANKKGIEDGDNTDKNILYFYYFEAARLQGFCRERLGKNQGALEIYNIALKAVEKMNIEGRSKTLANEVGAAMLEIYRKLLMKQEFSGISDRMNRLLGKGWEETTPKS